jgi:geranylgeranyl diphosphate synthase, type II
MSSKIKEFMEKINAAIESIDIVKKPEELYLPVDYCLRNGGKRVRPLMALLACDMYEGDIDKVMGPALGMEIFHNFTLMHDDIMDQAPMRRGVLAVHKKWNSNTAILSGDVMFALAIRHIALTPLKHLKTILDLFNRIVVEVCEGQQYDMNFETMDKVTEEDYLHMIRLKTAVLPAACLQAGAIIAGAPEKDTKLLYDFGENIGMAFQIKDDWLDCFGDEESFGKISGGDIVSNKKTWLYIKSFDMANKKQIQVLRDAFTNRLSNPDEKINTVRSIYFDLKLNKLALSKMEEYYEKAFRQLKSIDLPKDRKKDLEDLATNLFNRSI